MRSFRSGCNPSKVLEFVEEAFDQIAPFVEGGIESAGLAVGVERDIGAATLLFDEVNDPVGIVAAIGHLPRRVVGARGRRNPRLQRPHLYKGLVTEL